VSFVKLDCGILNSTLWVERGPRDVFITALLMAEPREILQPMPQLRAGGDCIEETGFVVPPGWYGFVPASGPGIVRMAMTTTATEEGMSALTTLGEPDPESRSHKFDGRRLVRVDGGYIVLNYIAYREKDATGADRAKRWRERQKLKESSRVTDTPSRVTDTPSRVTDTPSRVIRHQAEEEEAKSKSKSKSKSKEKPLFVGNLEARGVGLAGRACLQMRAGGCIQTNPSHVDLLAALDEGVTPEALADTAREAISSKKQNPFAWAIATARSRHAEGPTPITGGSHADHRESLAERAERKCREGDERERRAAHD
jgi:hypothetical protein